MKALRFAVLALFAPCAALANQTDDVEATGGSVIPSLGVSIDVVGRSSVRDHTPFSHAIDMGFAYAHATHKQDRDPGDQPVIFGGTTFLAANGDIDWTSNVQFAHIGYRPRYWFGGSNFALEGVIGVGWAGVGLKGQAGTLAATERFSATGLALGVGGIWRFLPATSLQLRYLGIYPGKKEGVTSAARFDLSVAHAIAKNLQVRGGLGLLGVYSAREDKDDNVVKSPVHAGGGGLFLGLDFTF